ncbi:MAG: hypothetical protein K2F76_04415, partial [Duncaniella dubosii]|nr:hypothetical protein [Duncaniella dubosii]
MADGCETLFHAGFLFIHASQARIIAGGHFNFRMFTWRSNFACIINQILQRGIKSDIRNDHQTDSQANFNRTTHHSHHAD